MPPSEILDLCLVTYMVHSHTLV